MFIFQPLLQDFYFQDYLNFIEEQMKLLIKCPSTPQIL